MLFRFLGWLLKPYLQPKKQKDPFPPHVRLSVWAEVYNTGTRINPIHSHYSPTWGIGDSESQYSARILFDEFRWSPEERMAFVLHAGEHHMAKLVPFVPYYWQNLQPGDIIKGYEGSKQTCYAVIKQIDKW